MKSAILTFAWLACWFALCLALSGCAIEETETTVTDAKSGLVTVTRKKVQHADKTVWSFAAAAANAYAPRAIVLPEK